MATSVTMRESQARTSKLWIFFLLVAGCAALFLIPAFIIRPFSYQSQRALMWAMKLRTWAPMGTLILFAGLVILFVSQIKRWATWKRVVAICGLALALLCTVMSRIDYFEWMFHPLPAPGFQSAEQVKLDPKQMVMAVRFGNDARAYPIRAMAYHHVVNDVVADVPIVVTY